MWLSADNGTAFALFVSAWRGGGYLYLFLFFFSSRRRHTRLQGDWSSDVCSSDLVCATHALLSGPAVERLSNAPITEVTVTDTVMIPAAKRFASLCVLSVGELLSKEIGRASCRERV